MAIVDDAGAVQNSYTYDVYGEASVTGSLANEFDFAGQQTDGDTGLQYLRARYMDPETGVFFSREPMAVVPPWLGSHFGYASGNPATATDPTGLDPERWGPDENWWWWRTISKTQIGGKRYGIDEIVDAGLLATILKHAKLKLGLGPCVTVLSCEYRVIEYRMKNIRTNEERTFVRTEWFLNLEVGVGAGALGVGLCLGLKQIDVPIPGPSQHPRGSGGGSW